MKNHLCAAVWKSVLAALALTLGVETLPAQNAPAEAPKPVKFRPQTSGATSVRVTGGSRGSGAAMTTLDVLTPDEVGLTTQEQPSLFWYQSTPARAKFELTLIEDNKPKPIVQVEMDRASQAGIQRLKLSDHNAKLVVGVEYQWVIALVTDPDNRSKDLVASGVIKRIEPAADLKQKIASATPASLPAVYADAGIWYDAFSTLSDQIEAHPGDQKLVQTRAELLLQVGLKAAANAAK